MKKTCNDGMCWTLAPRHPVSITATPQVSSHSRPSYVTTETLLQKATLFVMTQERKHD